MYLAQLAAIIAVIFSPSLLFAAGEPVEPCSQDEWDEYFAAVQNHVIGHWRPPFNYRAMSCVVLIWQDFRSEVEHVEVLTCDEDEKVFKSVENAAYLSSPLPRPKNRACFSKQMTIRLYFIPGTASTNRSQ